MTTSDDRYGSCQDHSDCQMVRMGREPGKSARVRVFTAVVISEYVSLTHVCKAEALRRAAGRVVGARPVFDLN